MLTRLISAMIFIPVILTLISYVPANIYAYADVPSKIHDLINQARQANSLKILKSNTLLAIAASSHSQDMANTNRLDHLGSDGSTSQSRIQNADASCSWWGENIYKVYRFFINKI